MGAVLGTAGERGNNQPSKPIMHAITPAMAAIRLTLKVGRANRSSKMDWAFAPCSPYFVSIEAWRMKFRSSSIGAVFNHPSTASVFAPLLISSLQVI